jgi:hypothetical protein
VTGETNATARSVRLTFNIQESNGLTAPCHIIAHAPEKQDVKTWSFYGQICKDDKWQISWGYSKNNDAGVMTVVK